MHISRALVASGFSVTAVQRAESKKTVPAGTHSVKVDLSSYDDLLAVFKGQDAVVRYVPLGGLICVE